ncbi:MAG TPA: D-alanyl-D-alanine carboxypeptidase [Streptosporangiaceae bacterium]|nr:D-alanyl-D-alanine carboxypeptidase [Streptosporangiaceae bacterium]
MRTRGRLTVRVCGLLAAVTLAATLLGAVAPARAAAAVSSTVSSPAAGPSGVAAWSAAVENAATGRLLWSRGLNTERPMASITKVMTAYLVIRAGHLDRKITIPAAVTGYVRAHNASNAGLRPGDRLTARQLLYALLLPSGADAAYTLAKAYGPGLSRFVTRMNATARQLSMRRTHFSNFDGLPYPTSYSNYSTAANLLVLGRAAMRLAVFRSVVAKRSYGLAAGSGHHAYRWKNLNPLLGRYPGAIGIKPGYTGAAGQCLLFEATRHGHTVIGVTLHSPGSISSVNPADAIRILNWAFSHLS